MPALPRLLFVLVVLLVSWLGQPVGSHAQTPACGPASVGLVACIADQRCTCRFAFGSPATGLADGYRWDCGILQPSCGEPLAATLDPYPGLLPEGLSIVRNSNTINAWTGKPDRPHGPSGKEMPER